MKASELKNLLTQTIPEKLPVLIKGAPGIGKSEIVEQAAEECDAEVQVFHPVIDEPIDYKGMPSVVEGRADFLPFGNLQRLIEADRLTVAFIDDFGQAPKVVQAALMQLVLARRVNEKKISDHVVFVGATNDRHHKAGVTGILEPMKSRFATIVELMVDVDDWCEWAFENEVPGEVIAFIKFRPEKLMDTHKPTNDIVNRPSPRTVVNVGELFKRGIKGFEVIAGAAGEAFAQEFRGFLKVWKELPSIESILLDPKKAVVPTEPSARYAICVALTKRVTEENAEKVLTYVKRLPEEFTVMTIRDSLRVCPESANNRSFIDWTRDNSDILA